MKICYNKLQKLMIDNQMKRQDLMRAAEITSYAATKINKNEPVSLEVLMRICQVFHCDIGDICEVILDEYKKLCIMVYLIADTLRKNKTIDWQKRESARAKMRMLIKKLLKKHKYPPEGMEDAVQTVMTQCELWTDNVMDA